MVFSSRQSLQFSRLSAIEEVEGVPTGTEMIAILTKSHGQVIRTAREVLKIAQASDDESTAFDSR